MQCVPARGSGGSRRLLSNTQIPPVTTLRLNVSPDIAPAEIAAATSAYASLLGHSCAPTNEMTHMLPPNAASDITSGVVSTAYPTKPCLNLFRLCAAALSYP